MPHNSFIFVLIFAFECMRCGVRSLFLVFGAFAQANQASKRAKSACEQEHTCTQPCVQFQQSSCNKWIFIQMSCSTISFIFFLLMLLSFEIVILLMLLFRRITCCVCVCLRRKRRKKSKINPPKNPSIWRPKKCEHIWKCTIIE